MFSRPAVPSPGFASPAVMVHGLQHARAAVAAGRPLTLLSAPGAACYAGCAWWRALVAAAGAGAPNPAGLADILDCAAAPGYAMAALRIGQAVLILDPACPGFAAVQAAAASLGARVLTHPPPSLDLAAPGALRHLPAWLAPAPADIQAGDIPPGDIPPSDIPPSDNPAGLG